MSFVVTQNIIQYAVLYKWVILAGIVTLTLKCSALVEIITIMRSTDLHSKKRDIKNQMLKI